MSFVPADQQFMSRVRESFGRQQFMTFIGAALAGIEPGRVTVSVKSRAELTQQVGYLHGGVVSTLADVAGGYAALTLFEPTSEILTVEFKINLIAPAQGEKLVAIGEVIKAGRTLTVCKLEVFARTGPSSTLCAVGQQTLIQLKESRP